MRKIKIITLGSLISVFLVFSFSSCKPHFELNSKPITKALIVVPNKDRVEVLDTSINRTTQTLATEQRPNSIAISPDGKIILVTNTKSNTVSTFLKKSEDDFVTLKPIQTCFRPIGVTFNPNKQLSQAYVACEGDNKNNGQIMVLDTTNRNSVPLATQVLTLPNSFPKKIAVNKNGDRLFVTDSKNGELILISIEKVKLNLISTITLGVSRDSLEGLLIDENNKRLYIANYYDDNLVVINLLNLNLVPKFISLKDSKIIGSNKVGPKNIAYYKNPYSGEEKLYVTGYKASVVSVVDVKNFKLIKNISLSVNTEPRESYNPIGVAILRSQETDYVYTSNLYGLEISLIDPITDTLKRNTSTTGEPEKSNLGEMITLGSITQEVGDTYPTSIK